MLDVKLGTHSNVTVNRMDLGIEYKQVKPTLPTTCSTLHHLPHPPLAPPYTTCPTHLLLHPTPLDPPASCSTLHHLPRPPLAPPYTTCPTHLLLHPTSLVPPTSCSTLHHLSHPTLAPPYITCPAHLLLHPTPLAPPFTHPAPPTSVMRLYPATVALPAVGRYKPVSTDIRVVFPAPWYTSKEYSKQTNKQTNNQ